MAFKTTRIDGMKFNAPEGTKNSAWLERMAESIPEVRTELEGLLVLMRSPKYDYDPYISVRELIPLIESIRHKLL